jgi:hypothetical protein
MEEEDSKSKPPLMLGKDGYVDNPTVANPVVENPTVEMVRDSWTFLLPPPRREGAALRSLSPSDANLYLITKCAHHMYACM